LSGKFAYERDEVWSVVSNKAKSFIETTLVTDPDRRPSAKKAQDHLWLHARSDKTDDNRLSPDVVRSLRHFKDVGDLRKLLSEVLSYTLLPDQLKDIRKEFEKVDIDGTGEVSLASLKHVLMANAGSSSFGALTEDEVEGIFNAMRVGRSETRVHWHEFIAAALSQCQVDERNLRLAFERLDNDHTGFLTYKNVMSLIEIDDEHSEEALKQMWDESLKACNRQRDIITYEDFLFLMYGPGEKKLHPELRVSNPLHSLKLSPSREMQMSLQVVDEGQVEEGLDAIQVPECPNVDSTRRRSRSVGDNDDDKDIQEPLIINRTLFRANRQLRLAVLEASKRFETQKAQRARDSFTTDTSQDGVGDDSAGHTGAGLVLRRRKQRKRIDSDVVRAWIRQNEKKKGAIVRNANKRSGAALRIRAKSLSDISGMMAPTSAGGRLSVLSSPRVPSERIEAPNALEVEAGPGLVPVRDRNSSARGGFRKTVDPFRNYGMYRS
jgi:Ca2+-binding EF-hand superfamily protein